ncbi:unnamed protein product [Lactuca saligna]|uniref:Uncharacterized protein n=1 Tax=Lactuca saligna TaxID=75948 RepID=A0AA35UQS1_LACSI|nr:unnamed protein product [Lactuca saligna]
MSNGDLVSFSLCHGLVELCDGLPTFVKGWKEEFFFVYTSSFPGLMRESIGLLAQNYVKWADPEEVTLGIVGVSPVWNGLGKKLVETMAGREVTLLDRLHKKRLIDSYVVVKEVIILDSPSL